MSLLKLFFIFAKIGAILLGGGYVILPIMLNEFAQKRHLVEENEIIDYFAISQSLPGIIAANISIFIGYKLRGKLGAVIAMLGVIFVPFWTIVLLASIVGALLNNIYMQGALRGVGIAVIVLIMLTVREMWQKSKIDIFFIVIFMATLISILYFKLSPVKAIIIYSIIGLGIQKFLHKKNSHEVGE